MGNAVFEERSRLCHFGSLAVNSDINSSVLVDVERVNK